MRTVLYANGAESDVAVPLSGDDRAKDLLKDEGRD